MKIFNKRNSQSEIFHTKLSMFREHYKSQFDIEPDDEIFYIIIRMNELQLALQKLIKEIQEVRFRSVWEYFMYALGSSLKWFWAMLSILALSSAIVYYADHKMAFQEHQNVKAQQQVATTINNGVKPIQSKADKQKNNSKKNIK